MALELADQTSNLELREFSFTLASAAAACRPLLERATAQLLGPPGVLIDGVVEAGVGGSPASADETGHAAPSAGRRGVPLVRQMSGLYSTLRTASRFGIETLNS